MGSSFSHQFIRKWKCLTILTVGIDLAKNVFAVHGVGETAKGAKPNAWPTGQHKRSGWQRPRCAPVNRRWVPVTADCAKSVVNTAHTRSDPISKWVLALKERSGWQKAVVALANKNARILWAVMTRGEAFDRQHVSKKPGGPADSLSPDSSIAPA